MLKRMVSMNSVKGMFLTLQSRQWTIEQADTQYPSWQEPQGMGTCKSEVVQNNTPLGHINCAWEINRKWHSLFLPFIKGGLPIQTIRQLVLQVSPEAAWTTKIVYHVSPCSQVPGMNSLYKLELAHIYWKQMFSYW